MHPTALHAARLLGIVLCCGQFGFRTGFGLSFGCCNSSGSGLLFQGCNAQLEQRKSILVDFGRCGELRELRFDRVEPRQHIGQRASGRNARLIGLRLGFARRNGQRFVDAGAQVQTG